MDANTDLIDDDPDISAAVGKILARGPAAFGDEAREDKRENRTDREPHEEQEDGELDAERDSVETKGEEGAEQAADTEGEQFLEIPGETDDAEPLKVPLSEAADAVKQIRQMNGDIATAIIKAETEAEGKANQLLSGMQERYREIELQAIASAQLMQAYLPQPPDRIMLDERSEYYDPVRYNALKAHYDDYVAYAQRVKATIGQARDGQKSVQTDAEKAEVERETNRLARYIPEWSDPQKREAKKDEIITALSAKYGITKDEFGDVVSHKAWRMMNDLAKLSQVQTKAPEIRKAVQEKAAKLTNGKMPAREQGTGRFVSDARKELRDTGSVDAAARLFMRSGLTRGL